LSAPEGREWAHVGRIGARAPARAPISPYLLARPKTTLQSVQCGESGSTVENRQRSLITAHGVWLRAAGRFEACPGTPGLPQSNPASAKLR